MNLHKLLCQRAAQSRPVRGAGYTVYGKLMPAADSLALGGLPIGLAHGCRLVRAVGKHQPIRWSDVYIAESEAVRTRRELEQMFRWTR